MPNLIEESLIPADNLILTVSQFTEQVKEVLESQLSDCWIRGEISNFRRQSSGHCYFSLKDKKDKDGYLQNMNLALELERLFSLGFKTKYLVSAGTAKPPFFIERGYKPIKKYTTGDWTRGLYTNVSNEDVIEATSKLFDDQTFNLPITSILKHPKRIFDYKVSSPKIVRSILIERA